MKPRAVASPTQPEGGGERKNFWWGHIFINFFKVRSEK